MNNKHFSLVFIIIIIATQAVCQVSHTVRLSYPLAQGTYSEKGPIGTHAGFGMGLGYRMTKPFNNLKGGGIGYYVGFDASYNLDFGYNDRVETFEENFSNVEMSWPLYFNMPVYAGINYTIKSNGKDLLYVRGGPVYNFFKITNSDIEFDDNSSKTKFGMSSGLGYSLGTSFRIGKVLSLEVDYLALGEYDIAYTQENSGSFYGANGTNKGTIVREVSILMISLGFTNFLN